MSFLSLSEKNYLIRNNLISLFKFSNKDISFHQFQIEAEIEKKEKLEKFEAERLKKENEIHLARIAEQALQERIENVMMHDINMFDDLITKVLENANAFSNDLIVLEV